MNPLEKYDILLIDLDNTIIDEKQYLFSAYRRIAGNAAKRDGIDEEKAFLYLQHEFVLGNRTGLFNRFITAFQLKHTSLVDCLRILRTQQVEGGLEVFPEVFDLLDKYIELGKRFALVTNGNKEQQRNKIDQVNWGKLEGNFDVVYTIDFEPKPSPRAILDYLSSIHKGPRQAVYVGDDPVDQLAAEAAGVDFVNVKNLSIIKG